MATRDATHPSEAASANGTGATPSASAPSRDEAKATALVEQGRALLRERGEAGAEDARAAFLQALAADPQCAAAYWELGWAMQVQGAFDDALATWDTLRTLAPDYPELAQNYPLLLMRRDQAATLAALPDPGALPPREEEPRGGPTLGLLAVGDVQMGTAWPEAMADLPPDDGLVLFAKVAALLKSAPVLFGNLETALADSGASTKCGKRSHTCYAFRVPTRFAKSLATTGFHVMSNANNHAGDFGPEARTSTMAALDAAGILHSGPIGDVAKWQQGALKVALIAFATGADMMRVQDLESARKLVAQTKRAHDLVLVSFHAGAEGIKATHVPKANELFYGEERGNVYAFAHTVIDAGADLVLGHGPHVLRGMEIYRGRFIAYSLGNFCTWKGFNLTGPLGVSGALRLELAANGVVLRAELVPLVLPQPGAPEPDPTGQAVAAVRALSQADFGGSVLDERGVYELRPRAPAGAKDGPTRVSAVRAADAASKGQRLPR